jgi:hypothetical protein
MIHFYCYVVTKTILISDQPVDKVRAKYGYRYELLNSIRDNSAVDIIKTRLLRNYSKYEFVEWYQIVRKPMSDETKRKMSEAKMGKPRDEATRMKISAGLKGRSNFQGKKHSADTKDVMAEKKLGNQHTKDSYWAYDSRSDKETRVRDRNSLPPGYQLGRDYYSTEAGLYCFREIKKPTISPKEIQTNHLAQDD